MQDSGGQQTHFEIYRLNRSTVRRLSLLYVLTFFALPSSAQDIRFDTLAVRPVGPGVIHTYIESPSIPWTINVLEVDLTDPFLKIETAKAHNLLAGGYERTSSMARRHDEPGHRVVGGVNGDFYVGGGRPVNIQVLGGEILQDAHPGRPAIGFDLENRPAMEFAALEASLFLSDTALVIHDVNGTRDADELVLYNQYRGSATGTNQYGTEVRVRSLERWIANDTLRLVVSKKAVGSGNTSIPDGEAVLSGHGSAGSVLANRVEEGDTLTAYLGIQPRLPNVEEVMGGHPFLVRDGVSSVGPRGDASDRHPRTAAGFSADSTKLYLITVDGRQSTSEGITLPELAYFMIRIGVHTGMNLDGGGSTTMVVRDEIANSPSDGSGERAVSNALLVVSSAPEGPLSRLFVFPEQTRLFMGHSTEFTVYGTDEYYKPIPLDTSRLELSADPEIGTIDEQGRFTAGSDSAVGYVYARYGGDLVDSARVVVKTVARFELSPPDVLTDTSLVVTFSIRSFDVDGVEQEVPPTEFTWRSTNPEVGVVDEEGRFQGLSSGTTQVIAEHRGLEESATVTVDIRAGVSTVSSMEEAEIWQLDGQNIDLSASELSTTTEERSEGEGALRLDYSFVYDPAVSNEAFLESDLPIEGVPDSLFMDVKSDGRKHRVFYDVEDALGRTFQLFAAAYADNAESFETLPSAFARAQGQFRSWTMHFPVTLKRVIVRLASDRVEGETYTGTLYLDNLRITYPAKTTAAEAGEELPGTATLLANYPNPFSRQTVVAYDLGTPQQIELSLYDVLGRRVVVLDEGFRSPGRHEVTVDAGSLSSGIYFYRLHTPARSLVGRMTLAK